MIAYSATTFCSLMMISFPRTIFLYREWELRMMVDSYQVLSTHFATMVHRMPPSGINKLNFDGPCRNNPRQHVTSSTTPMSTLIQLVPFNLGTTLAYLAETLALQKFQSYYQSLKNNNLKATICK